jgi:hypothetical protein
MGRLVIVVPLREGADSDARALLRYGPPVHPESGDLEHYSAFVSSREAVLVLEGPGVGGAHEHRWGDLRVWRDGARWKRCAQSWPRLAESVDSWRKPPELTGVSFGPLPGPGDSEGG